MVQQVKRGRGRPRKVQTEDNMVNNDSFDAGPVVEPVQEEASVAPEASSNFAMPYWKGMGKFSVRNAFEW